MGDDEQWVFEVDGEAVGDDDGQEEEVTWETEVENRYQDAKALMDTKPLEAISIFHEVIKEDKDKGRWTFKALKWIARTCVRAKFEDRLPAEYRKAMEFTYSAKTKQDAEKFINKFFDRSGSTSQACMKKCCEETIAVLATDAGKGMDKVWFMVRYRMAQISLAEGLLAEVERDIAALHEWCGEGPAAEERRGTQKFSVYALEVQLRSEQGDVKRVRDLYQRAMNIKSAMPTPRILGIIRESGGRVFMRQAMWTEAYDAFFQAFRSFDEAGDPRRIACLKYLVVSSMLSGSAINPFDTNEARSYQSDPEIVAMTELTTAYDRNDVVGFFKVLNDKKNMKAIRDDTFLYGFIEPLVQKVQMQAIKVITKPYTTIKIDYVAENVLVSPKETELLIFRMILDGALAASIDQLQGVVRLHERPKTEAPVVAKPAASGAAAKGAKKEVKVVAAVPTRYETLKKLAEREAALHQSVMSHIR